jgi:hypothetical protein
MRYLVLSADYNSFLRDEFDDNFSIEDLGLSKNLESQLNTWYSKYLPVITMSSDERLRAENLIIELDKIGCGLAEAIIKSTENTKVKYYSEGHLRYL